MKFFLFAIAVSVPLAAANPWRLNPFSSQGVCAADKCASAVTGTNAAQPLATRQADCSSFLSPVPTPIIPTYASSACGGGTRYASACGCLGVATPTYTCLSSAKATDIVDKFSYLLTSPQAPDFTAKATALLADDVEDFSDSINFLAGYPLGGATFPNRTAFVAGQGAQKPIPTLTTLDIFFSCNKIAWRWLAKGIGSGVNEVKGIDTFTINPSGLISEINAEFDSGAWIVDVGGTCEFSAPAPATTS